MDDRRTLICKYVISSTIALLLPFLSPTHLFAASFTTEGTDKRPQHISQLNDTETVDLHRGNLIVRQQDINLPGNGGLNIEIWRTYDMHATSAGLTSTHNKSYKWTTLGLGWTLSAAPKISFEYSFVTDYQDEDPGYLGKTFTHTPYPILLCQGRSAKDLNGWSGGIPVLDLPDGKKELLYAHSPYKALSKSGWKFDCPNGKTKLTSPNGITYDFGNIHVDRYVGTHIVADSEVQLLEGQHVYRYPNRATAYLLAKTATDPNGNTLSYTYKKVGNVKFTHPLSGYHRTSPGYLTSNSFTGNLMQISEIKANDGRKIFFKYDINNHKLLSISDGQRAWTYEYTPQSKTQSESLSRVVLPNGETWKFGYAPGPFFSTNRAFQFIQQTDETVSSRKLIQIINPQGGAYRYVYGWRSDSGVSKNRSTGIAKTEHVKSRSTPNGDTWSYSYTRGKTGKHDITTVTAPNGIHKYYYMGTGFLVSRETDSTKFQNNAWLVGSLIRAELPGGRTEQYEYQKRLLAPNQTNIIEHDIVKDQNVWVADLHKRTITQNGTAYVTEFADYDTFGNPGVRTEKGPNGGSRVTKLTYFNDPRKWITGRLKDEIFPDSSVTRTFDTNGKVLAINRNGVVTRYTYDAQGNVASQTQPGNRAYTYSNYKRGIPQTEVQP